MFCEIWPGHATQVVILGLRWGIKRYHRSDSVRCDLLIDHAVVTGNKVPYSEDLLWFSPKTLKPPEKIDYKWFYSGETRFELR